MDSAFLFIRFKKYFASAALLAGIAAWALADGHTAPPHHHHPGCVHEPSLPPLLIVTRDAADPDRLNVELLGNVEGNARINVEAPAPVLWDQGISPARARLEKGSRRDFGLRVARAAGGQPRRVKVSLTIENDAGQPTMSVQHEVALDPEPAPNLASASIHIEGRTVDGDPVSASVPADAPQPTVSGAAQ